jgi:hypothetical protein
MSFHTWQKKIPLKPQIKFHNIDINYELEIKFLGVHIRGNMKWDGHIKYLSSKLSKSYYVITSLKDLRSLQVIRGKYFVYFHVHMRYGLVLWGGDPNSNGIFKLQKRVIRLISNVGRKLSKALNILIVPCIYIQKVKQYAIQK